MNLVVWSLPKVALFLKNGITFLTANHVYSARASAFRFTINLIFRPRVYTILDFRLRRELRLSND